METREYVRSSGVWIGSGEKVLYLSDTGNSLNDSQTVTLSEPISKQKNGIILIWSRWVSEGVPANDNWNYSYIPRYQINLPGSGGVALPMGRNSDGATFKMKYVYITDTQISGHSMNSPLATGNDLTLRRVIGY